MKTQTELLYEAYQNVYLSEEDLYFQEVAEFLLDEGFTEDEKLCIRISNLDQCNSVIRKYLNDSLSTCTDEKVLEGMMFNLKITLVY